MNLAIDLFLPAFHIETNIRFSLANEYKILWDAEVLPNQTIAKALKTSRRTVVQWRKRFKEQEP